MGFINYISQNLKTSCQRSVSDRYRYNYRTYNIIDNGGCFFLMLLKNTDYSTVLYALFYYVVTACYSWKARNQEEIFYGAIFLSGIYHSLPW